MIVVIIIATQTTEFIEWKCYKLHLILFVPQIDATNFCMRQPTMINTTLAVSSTAVKAKAMVE